MRGNYRDRAVPLLLVALLATVGGCKSNSEVGADMDGAVDAAPGTVMAVRPKVQVACGEGSVVLLGTFTKSPVPWPWPAPWNFPNAGETLTSGDPWTAAGDG